MMTLAFAVWMGLVPVAAAEDEDLDEGPTVAIEDTWDLSHMYATLDDWQKEHDQVDGEIPTLENCKGKLSSSGSFLRQCLDEQMAIAQRLAKLGSYAFNKSSEDTRDAPSMSRTQAVGLLWTKFGKHTSWMEPELVAMGQKKLDKLLRQDKALANNYTYYLRKTMEAAEHTLSADEEALLAAGSTVRQGPSRVYKILLSAEFPWPTITLSTGEEVELRQSEFERVRTLPNREDRKLVFDSFFGALQNFEGTIGSALNAHLNGHWYLANTHHHETSLAAALEGSRVPPEVYRTLVEQTNAQLPTLHRYLRLRARMLEIDEIAYYDIYPALVETEIDFPLQKAKDLTIASCEPLGDEYVSMLKEGFDNRWMDVYPSLGKSSGAYSDGSSYDVHPYVLMNYNDDFLSASTLAHEFGHAVHSHLANEAQPFHLADYTTFIAEIASTFNEALLLDYQLESVDNDEERLFYLGQALDKLRGTYFRQALFAEFELAIHEKVEAGEPLTGEAISALYLELLRRYHGHEEGVMEIDEAYGIEWAYVRHFYYNFYVYQYATSLAASSLLAESVLKEEEGAVERHLNLLRAGGSDDPDVLLKTAGVDLTTAAPYEAVATQMNAIMDEIEAILERRAEEPTPEPEK
ncbi:MAG: oligoendopeptidase F [Proteobacteria bacterium]|jgi:oligoendopeptidase F|nr:oligoendopeptidase F [Pseudomonadota bacterium]